MTTMILTAATHAETAMTETTAPAEKVAAKAAQDLLAAITAKATAMAAVHV